MKSTLLPASNTSAGKMGPSSSSTFTNLILSPSSFLSTFARAPANDCGSSSVPTISSLSVGRRVVARSG